MYRLSLYLLLWTAACQGVAQTPLFREHKPEAWGDVKIRTLFQDRNGWVWMGSNMGVFSYDGLAFESFQLPDSVPGPQQVRSIGEWNGQIWAGFESGWVAAADPLRRRPNLHHPPNDVLHYQKGVLAPWEPEEGTPQAPVSGWASGPDGIQWMATYGEGLYALTQRRVWLFNNEDEGLAGDDIYALVSDDQGRAWAATDNGVSICALQPDGTKSVKNISLAEGLPDVVVTALAKDPQGRIWMGSNNGGIWWVDPLTLAVHRPCPEWPYGEVHTIAAFSPYEIWCAGSEGGLLQINPATGAVQVVAPDWRIRQLMRDREGQLWLLLENGTVWSANLQVLRMHTPSQPVQAVCKDREGRLWVGAQNGLWRYAEGRWIPAGRPGLNVISLMVSPQGEVWAGTFGQGICVFSPEGRLLRCITTRNGLPNGSILSMAAGDFAWAGTLDGLVGIDWVSYQVRRFSALSGQAAAERFYIYKLLTDRTGALWMCTDGHGICRWSPGKWECFEEGAGVSLKTVYTAAEDRTGAIWLAGAFTGLLRFDGARFTRYGSEQHLHSTHIQSIVPTPDGKIVIAYSDGIDILTPETGHVTFLGENAGVATAEHHLNAAWCDGEGQVWLGATEGLSRVAGFAQDFAIDPFTIISSVTVSSQIIDFQKEKVFAYDQNHLLIEYNGIWHTHPGAVFFRYRLEGFDPDWILSKDRLVSYPNLPPGKYVFRVQSSEHGRFEHTGEAVFVFEIKKPFWTEWWFVLLGILGALLALRAYVQAREKRMLREKELQNEKIAAQLSAIKTQINPHFLFNSFNTLVTLIEENPGLAVDYVQHLSDFYRSIMIYREKDLIPLSEELKIAENFGFLLKKRYEDALLITLPENRAEKSGYVFPLTLQMLMENAVKHNVISKKQPLQLVISFEKGGYIVVSNNLHLKIKPEPGAGFGLQSLIHRYALMTGQKVIVTDANGWFSVKIPLVQYEHTIS